MKRRRFIFFLLPFLLYSFLLGMVFLFIGQIGEFSIKNHSFRPSAFPVILLCLLFFLLLLGIWMLYSKIISKIFLVDYNEVLAKDFLSYIPVVFFLFLPFANTNYLSSEDLLKRCKLLIIAVIFSFLYLKTAHIYRLLKEKPSLFKNWAERFSSISLKRKLALLFIAAVVLYNAGAALMVSEGAAFSGDEPHYLLISHSLTADGDFDLANNYSNRDYTKFLLKRVRIKSHVAPGTEGRYSFHSPGTSLVILPFCYCGSLFGGKLLVIIVRFGMSIFGALLGLQIFLYARQEWENEKLAFALWFLYAFSSPIFFYSIHIYPEIIIALFSLTVFRIFRFSESFSRLSLLFCGFLLSTFIWFHTQKYIFIMVPLFIYGLWVLIKKHRIGWNLIYFLAFPFGLTIFYFFFQYSLYGSFSFSAVSTRGALSARESLAYLKVLMLDIPFRYRWESLAGYFFDQRDGLLLYAPIYFFSFLGMIEMAKRKSRDFILLLFLTVPYVINYAFLTQRTGYAPQARPLVSVSWALAIFVGFFLVYNMKKIFSTFFSVAVFLSCLAVFLLLKNPLALYQLTTRGETERAGKLFLLLSNLHFSLPRFLPSYLKIDNSKWIPNYVWAGAVLLFAAAYLVVKRRRVFSKFSFHVVFSFIGVTVFFIWFVLYPRTIITHPEKAAYPSGEKMNFYSIGRVARMIEPGKFHLPDDDRAYVFNFTSWRRIEKIRLNFGSLKEDYYVKIKYFDSELFQGYTKKEIKTLYFSPSPSYRLKRSNMYQISIYLEKKPGPVTYEDPYVFSILPSSTDS